VGVNIELRKRLPQARKGGSKGQLVELITDDEGHLVDLLLQVRGGGRTPILDRIDPYGDLVVSGADISRLIAELPALVAAARSEGEKGLLTAFERVARQCAAPSAEYRLHFSGD
jgi:hypothetical protein